MSYSGAGKDEFCNRLGNDWKNLADRLEIPTAVQRQFLPGDEGRAIWAWLEQRGRLSALPATLAAIGRAELAAVLVERQQTDARRYYQNRIDFWSQERFKLDRRFVRLTLWLDQGEDAAGQRWQAQPRQFEDLGHFLKRLYLGIQSIFLAAKGARSNHPGAPRHPSLSKEGNPTPHSRLSGTTFATNRLIIHL